MIKKSSVRKKIIAALALTTTVAFSTLSLFPIFPSLSSLMNVPLTASANGFGTGYSSGSVSSANGVGAGGDWGLRMYVVNRDGDIVKRYKATFDYGLTRADGSPDFPEEYIYEGSKEKAEEYADYWLLYKVLRKDKETADALWSQLNSFFSDEANKTKLIVNGTEEVWYKLDDVIAIIDNFNNGFKFEKEKTKENIRNLTKHTEGTIDYIQKFDSNQFAKWDENKTVSGKDGNKAYDLKSGLYAPFDRTDTTKYSKFVSGGKVDTTAVHDFRDDNYVPEEDYWDVRFPLGNSVDDSNTGLWNSNDQGEKHISDIPGYLSGLSKYMPTYTYVNGSGLKGWMLKSNDSIPNASGLSDMLKTSPAGDLNDNYFAIVSKLFYDGDEGENFGIQNIKLFNGLDKLGGINDRAGSGSPTPLQSMDKFPAFHLVVEPIVNIPFYSNGNTHYDTKSGKSRFLGTFTGYLRNLNDIVGDGSITDCFGGSQWMTLVQGRTGRGMYTGTDPDIKDPDNPDVNLTYVTYGDKQISLLNPDGNLYSKKWGYKHLYVDQDDGNVTDYESYGWGMEIFFPSGTWNNTTDIPDMINTYAVDAYDWEPNDSVVVPPDRSEMSRDESGTEVGITNSSTTSSNVDTNYKTSGDGTFQIVKVYADLYRSNDKIDLAEVKVNNTKQQDVVVDGVTYKTVGAVTEGNMYYTYNNSGSEYDGKYVFVREESPGEAHIYKESVRSVVMSNPNYYMYEYPTSDPDKLFIENSSDIPLITDDPILVSSVETPELTRYYTKVEPVGFYYTTDTSRNVYISDELDKTNDPSIPLQGYKLLAWHTSSIYETDQSTQFSAADWLSLNTSSEPDSLGGYKLKLDFNRDATGCHSGDVNESEFRYDPTEMEHLYSRLYENQTLPNAAAPGINASGNGFLTIDEPSQHTIYLLYVRELEDIKTDGGDPGEPDNPSDSSTTYTTKDNHNPPNGDNPNPSIPHTWTPGKPTGGKTTNGRDPFKLNIVKVYGTINPYTMEVADDVTIYQSSNTYNVNISDEYGRTDVNGDTSPYHLRAYTLTNTTPIDGIPAGISGAYPSGSGYTASQWADGWQRSGFDYKNTDNNNAGQYAHHGFIDGYDGWSGNDGKTNPKYGDTVGDGVKKLIPTNKNILDAQTEGHKDITSFQTLMQKHFNSSSSGADTDDRYMIEWTGGSYTKGIQGLYVYPNEGYDKTIYFGDYVDKSSEGTLYLLYLKEDSIVYRSDPLVIPESYITRAFDLNENKITLSGDATALYRSYVGGGGSNDTTGEATHSLMEHRFIFTTEDNRTRMNNILDDLWYQNVTNKVVTVTNEDGTTTTNTKTEYSIKHDAKNKKTAENDYNNGGAWHYGFKATIDLIAANGTIINTPYYEYGSDGLTYADGSKVDAASDISTGGGAGGDFLDAKAYAAGTAGYFYDCSVLGRYYISGEGSLRDITKDNYEGSGIEILKDTGFTMDIANVHSNSSDDDWCKSTIQKLKSASPSVISINGLSYITVFGRVNDVVTVADYKYHLKAEDIVTGSVTDSNTGKVYHYDIQPYYRNNLPDITKGDDAGIVFLQILEYQQEEDGNRTNVLSSIVVAGSDSNRVNSSLSDTNGDFTLGNLRDRITNEDRAKDIINDAIASSLTFKDYAFSGSNNLLDTYSNLALYMSPYMKSNDYTAVKHSNDETVKMSAIDVGYKNSYLRQSYGWVRSEINDVNYSTYVTDSEANAAFNLRLFGNLSEYINATNVVADNKKYHGHTLYFTNRALYNTTIGLVKSKLAWLEETNNLEVAYSIKIDDSCTDLWRYFDKYSMSSHYVHGNGELEATKTSGKDNGISSKIKYQNQSDINITIPVYNYSYSGITNSPYYLANTGLSDGLGGHGYFTLGFEFGAKDTDEAKVDLGDGKTGWTSLCLANIQNYNGVQDTSIMIESAGTKMSDLGSQASITDSPLVVKKGDTEMGVRQSAVTKGKSIKVYPYYMMQVETANRRNYSMTVNGEVESKLGARLLLMAGSYSRTFVPDEYFGINIHDANSDKYGTPTVGIVNNISSDGKMSGGSGYIRITSDQWSTHATSNQVLGVQNCALPGGALFGVDIDKDSRRELEVISYQPILTGTGREHVLSTKDGFASLSPDVTDYVTAGLPSDINDTVGGARNSIVANHLQFANSVRSYLGSVNIDTYVDQSSEGVVPGLAEDYELYTNLYTEDSKKISQDALENVEDKYYLRQDNDAEGTDSEKEVKDQLKNEADIDVSPLELNPDGTFGGDGTKTDITYYTFYTTVDGRIMCHISNDLATSAYTENNNDSILYMLNEEDCTSTSTRINKVVTVLGRGQGIDALTGEYKDFNDRTQIIQKLIEAFERNHGYDKENYFPDPTNTKWNGIRDISATDHDFTGWYNEAFDGITYAVIKTTMQVGFNNPYERGAVLDPTLTPSSATKSDMFTRYNVSQFATADYSLKALDTKIDGYTVDGGKVKVKYASVDPRTGQTSANENDELSLLGVVTDINGHSTPVGIDPGSLKKLFVSDIFFIPNVTVQDLK